MGCLRFKTGLWPLIRYKGAVITHDNYATDAEYPIKKV